jgi:hypothetical protein
VQMWIEENLRVLKIRSTSSARISIFPQAFINHTKAIPYELIG